MQKQINELEQSPTEITEFLTSIAQRQVEENQALGRKLNQSQIQKIRGFQGHESKVYTVLFIQMEARSRVEVKTIPY